MSQGTPQHSSFDATGPGSATVKLPKVLRARSSECLPLSKRARRVLRQFSANTLGAVEDLTDAQILEVRGSGPATLRELHLAIQQLACNAVQRQQHAKPEHPAQWTDLSSAWLARPIEALGLPTDQTRELQDAGLFTIGLLRQDRSCVQEGSSLERAIDAAMDRAAALQPADNECSRLELLPAGLLSKPLNQFPFSNGLREQLIRLGCHCFADLLMLPAHIFRDGAILGESGGLEIRAAVEEFWSRGTTNVPSNEDHGDRGEVVSATPDFLTLQGRLLAPLPKASRQLLCKLLGLHTQRHSAPELAVALGMDLGQCRARVDSIRTQLRERSPTLLRLLRRELDQLLENHGGILTIESVPSPTVANTLANGSGHRLLPFRLAEFCFPELYSVYAQRLVSCSASELSLIAGKLRQLTEPRHLPRSLDSLHSELAESATKVPDGLLRFLLVRESRCQIKQQADRKDWVKVPDKSLIGRVTDVMKQGGQPTTLVDLVFEYRDRFRHASQRRIERCMRQHRDFLELGPGLWSLREWHLDELLALRDDADELAAAIEVCEESRDVGALLASETAEHSIFLIVDILRDDPRLTYLGRGRFRARRRTRSAVLNEVLRALHRAMGELPLARFLDNQPARRRRLVATLIRENRLFVSPVRGRVDLLTNYPFNEERMQRLLELVAENLDTSGGYACLEALRDRICETDLGGDWLTTDLLADILRRHGNYEFLPGGLLAHDGMQLSGWIQARAREALRTADSSLTPEELLAEVPDLAAFSNCLPTLLEGDPLVHSPDGMHYLVR